MKIGFHSNTGQVSDRVVNGERFLGWQLYHNRPIGSPSREPLCIRGEPEPREVAASYLAWRKLGHEQAFVKPNF